MTKLTEHFTLEEFIDSQTAARKGINNAPPPLEYENLKRTAGVLEKVRPILGGHPILISSGYRSRRVNAEVGGSANSAHMHGLAVDFSCPGFGAPRSICRTLEPHMKELGVDQLIHEFNTWVHLGLRGGAPPRHIALTINHKGTRQGFIGWHGLSELWRHLPH